MDLLPLDTTVAHAVAAVYPVRVLPPVTISCSHEHAGWAGTVSISATTLVAIASPPRCSATA